MGEMILTYNPIAFLLDAYRQALMFDTRPDLGLFAGNLLVFGGVLFFAVLFMRKHSQDLALKALTA
jgi:lipopolysaccharide transport system permease protein